jgi:hypothetical protein
MANKVLENVDLDINFMNSLFFEQMSGDNESYGGNSAAV